MIFKKIAWGAREEEGRENNSIKAYCSLKSPPKAAKKLGVFAIWGFEEGGYGRDRG